MNKFHFFFFLHSNTLNTLYIISFRWLWTSGMLTKEGYIPWDNEISNISPHSFVWNKDTNPNIITVKLGELYRLSIAGFTLLPTAIVVLLNDEPIFTLAPQSMFENNMASIELMTNNLNNKSDNG